VGFSLSLPLGYGWSPRGKPLRVPKHWGSAGRINLIGSLGFDGDSQQLAYRLLEGSCRAPAVVAYLDTLAQAAHPRGKLTVVVLDNAGFHRATVVQDKRREWEAMNLYLRYLPPYSPQLNPLENVWRRVKGFLMPRRCYAGKGELLAAVRAALAALGAVEV
jgi:putative transposase